MGTAPGGAPKPAKVCTQPSSSYTTHPSTQLLLNLLLQHLLLQLPRVELVDLDLEQEQDVETANQVDFLISCHTPYPTLPPQHLLNLLLQHSWVEVVDLEQEHDVETPNQVELLISCPIPHPHNPAPP